MYRGAHYRRLGPASDPNRQANHVKEQQNGEQSVRHLHVLWSARWNQLPVTQWKSETCPRGSRHFGGEPAEHYDEKADHGRGEGTSAYPRRSRLLESSGAAERAGPYCRGRYGGNGQGGDQPVTDGCKRGIAEDDRNSAEQRGGNDERESGP